MKLAIWYKYIEAPFGGSNNFLRRLASAISARGHSVVLGYEPGVDAVLLNSFVRGPNQYLVAGEVAQVWATGKKTILGRLPGAAAWYAKRARKGPPVVHRVDGVTKLYGRNTPKADLLTMDVNRFADLTIFQSDFCRQSFYDLGMHPKAATIIHNGVPADVFYPSASYVEPSGMLRLVAVSWSSNPMKGFATLSRLSLVSNVAVTFVGNWPRSVAAENVNIVGVRRETEIASLLRDHDALVHPALNEPSSNVIIEALSSGLPVLFADSGGNREIVGDCGLPLGDDLRSTVEDFRRQHRQLRERILSQRYRFSIEYVAARYVEAIVGAVDRARQ